MADYGLKVWDADGNLVLDATDRVTRMRYITEVAAGAEGSVNLPDISGLDSVQISVSLDPTSDWAKCAHKVERTDTTISWSVPDGVDSANSLIFVFLYT